MAIGRTAFMAKLGAHPKNVQWGRVFYNHKDKVIYFCGWEHLWDRQAGDEVLVMGFGREWTHDAAGRKRANQADSWNAIRLVREQGYTTRLFLQRVVNPDADVLKVAGFAERFPTAELVDRGDGYYAKIIDN